MTIMHKNRLLCITVVHVSKLWHIHTCFAFLNRNGYNLLSFFLSLILIGVRFSKILDFLYVRIECTRVVLSPLRPILLCTMYTRACCPLWVTKVRQGLRMSSLHPGFFFQFRSMQRSRSTAKSINRRILWQLTKVLKEWLQICLWFHTVTIMWSKTQRPNVYNSKLPDPKGQQQDSLKFLAEVKYIVCSSTCSWLRLRISINDHVLRRWRLDWQRQS